MDMLAHVIFEYLFFLPGKLIYQMFTGKKVNLNGEMREGKITSIFISFCLYALLGGGLFLVLK